MFEIVLIFASLFRYFWFNLYSLDILRSFGEQPVRWTNKGYIDTLLSFQMFFDFQGQVFLFWNCLCLSSGKAVVQENCYIYYKCCFIVCINKGYIDTPLSIQILFDFQSQFFLFWNCFCLSFGTVVGQENCYIYYKCAFIFCTNKHRICSVEI
jgi:hypothetical protein